MKIVFIGSGIGYNQVLARASDTLRYENIFLQKIEYDSDELDKYEELFEKRWKIYDPLRIRSSFFPNPPLCYPGDGLFQHLRYLVIGMKHVR